MDENVDRATSRAGSLTRPSSRNQLLDETAIRSKQAGVDFAMDKLTERLNGNFLYML